MKILFERSFEKDLKKIKETKLKKEIKKSILLFSTAGKLSDIKNIKKLTGYKNVYRLKIGDYRIGFFYEDNTIILSRILHRKDTYKKFP